MERLSKISLRHPLRVAFVCFAIGMFLGLIVEAFLCLEDGTWIGRFGSLTVALGVLTFGGLTSHLITRSQVARFADLNGDTPYPYNKSNLNFVFSVQTVLVVAGTLQ